MNKSDKIFWLDALNRFGSAVIDVKKERNKHVPQSGFKKDLKSAGLQISKVMLAAGTHEAIKELRRNDR